MSKCRLTRRHGKHAVQIGGETRRNDIGWLALADYEDLEEQGRLYVLPCGIGKPLYVIQGQIQNWDEESLTFSVKHIIRTVTPSTVEGCMVWKDDIEHERAFLTKEEAIAKLKELEG